MSSRDECCGCCAGTDAETPGRIDNSPGQDAIVYRVGVHARFKESLLARLSSARLPALSGLSTRDDTDFTIALCDALATTLHVLGFYQERIAQESYLRTATERRSVLELARLIGYRLAPGVAAGTRLAFTLQEVPGSPALAAEPVTIPAGTRVQSVPGPGEQAQSFETVEPAEGRVEWNVIPVQTALAWHPRFGDTELSLGGVGNQVQAGDVILIVGEERVEDVGSERWDIRLVAEAKVDAPNQRTRLRWDAPLGTLSPHRVDPADRGAAVYVFRQRAALFGHNAPDPRLITFPSGQEDLTAGSGVSLDWDPALFRIHGTQIDLDAAYGKITPGSWFALVSNETTANPSGLPGYVELYRATAVGFPSRTDFGLSGRITRLSPDTDEHLDVFRRRIRQTLVVAQSELLPVTDTPLDYPLYGDVLAMGRIVEGVAPGRALAVSGKRPRVRLRRGRPDVPVTLAAGGTVNWHEGDSVRLVTPPERSGGTGPALALSPADFGDALANPSGIDLRLQVLDRDGSRGTCTVAAESIELTPPDEADEEVREIAFVGALPTAVTQDRDRTTFVLAESLFNCYDRASVRVNANVARATHGETVREILGGGDARQPNMSFALRQTPLTYVTAATPSGSASTLQLRANDLLWTEVPSLFMRGPSEPVYQLVAGDEGGTDVRFGDGVEGARAPSGDHNIRATYRKGLGRTGNVGAGKLTNLLSRPLGVTGVVNPQAASGGEDPETGVQARGNAPVTVLTLDRAVSIRDYRDFARAFSGIAKAHALWIPSGPARGVFLSVAGEQGAEVSEGSDTFRDLQEALRRFGDALLPLRIRNYEDRRFRVRVAVKLAEEADPDLVMAAILVRVRDAFGFDARGFGQGVSVDEVSGVVQAVAGVAAVHVAELHRLDAPTPVLLPRLFAALPTASLAAVPAAAELLTVDAGTIGVERLP